MQNNKKQSEVPLNLFPRGPRPTNGSVLLDTVLSCGNCRIQQNINQKHLPDFNGERSSTASGWEIMQTVAWDPVWNRLHVLNIQYVWNLTCHSDQCLVADMKEVTPRVCKVHMDPFSKPISNSDTIEERKNTFITVVATNPRFLRLTILCTAAQTSFIFFIRGLLMHHFVSSASDLFFSFIIAIEWPTVITMVSFVNLMMLLCCTLYSKHWKQLGAGKWSLISNIRLNN